MTNTAPQNVLEFVCEAHLLKNRITLAKAWASHKGEVYTGFFINLSYDLSSKFRKTAFPENLAFELSCFLVPFTNFVFWARPCSVSFVGRKLLPCVLVQLRMFLALTFVSANGAADLFICCSSFQANWQAKTVLGLEIKGHDGHLYHHLS